MRRIRSYSGIAAVVILLLLAWSGAAAAGQATLRWDANTEPELAGYKLYYGTAPGAYGTPVSVGNVTS
jgi:hypothetical protein